MGYIPPDFETWKDPKKLETWCLGRIRYYRRMRVFILLVSAIALAFLAFCFVVNEQRRRAEQAEATEEL